MVSIATRLRATLLLAGITAVAAAQTATGNATGPAQLSPQSAYDQVLEPLEITRRSFQNWSDSEVAAFAIATKQASVACQARTPGQFTGDDLIAYARLCTLGQQWPEVSEAAAQYIGSTDAAKPQLTKAYAFGVDAALHSGNEQSGLGLSLEMLSKVPFDLQVDQTMQEALHYLQLAFTADALSLYAAREPYLLNALRTAHAPTGASGDTMPVTKVEGLLAVPVHMLYADGLTYAALKQFANRPEESAAIVANLDHALPALLGPDDAIPIAGSRRQYDMLGKKLPAIPLTVSLFAEHETPHFNPNYGSATALFLFPPWCAQCVRMGQSFMQALYRLGESDVRVYGLLAQAPPPVAAPGEPAAKSTSRPKPPVGKEGGDPKQPKTAADMLVHTPTLIVPPETLEQFAATDFPLLIATDHRGIVRFIQPAPETALEPGDFLDRVTAHIAEQWPPPTPASQAVP